MSLLKSEPPAPVRSLDELFAIAEALEEEAASRYAELATRMRVANLPTVAETFEHLAAEERGHAEHVMAWSRARTGAAPDPALIRWRPPETFDEEEARGIASSRLASAYRALSMAVRNEERAFALWTYIAAQSDDADIRAAAERMAGEELRHAALLRRERRRAFHAERPAPHKGSSASRRPPVEEAAAVERALAAQLTELARRPDGNAELRRLAEESAGMADEATVAAEQRDQEQASPAPADAERDVLKLSERSVEAYLDAADAAGAEDAMARLQSLAERAIVRAAALRRIAGQD